MFAGSFLKTKYFALLILTPVALFALAGCGSSEPLSLIHPAATATATPTVRSGNTAIATLKHMPTGTAVLTWNYTDQTLTVQMMLTGLAPGSTHPAHIHEGDCSENGKILYPLIDLIANDQGVAQAASKISVPKGIPASGWSINVHNGPGLTNAEQALPIACGNVVNHDTSLRSNQTVQVALGVPADTGKGQDASGTAHFTLTNHVLTVQMTLTGLAPKTEHAAHIHAGTCASQGKVLYPLPMITADASGKATLTTTIQNVSAIPDKGWYINVHHSADLSTQTGFDPIACGDITLS
ncbi:MAG TPA: CHRD domain-containing protein [Ktedonobacteraceae bacterium]|nr:CHRD domain-containing protein [Ktedonobacteraceae bacterium]